jgi:hypothetical protein
MQLVEEAKRSIHDAICVTRNLVRYNTTFERFFLNNEINHFFLGITELFTEEVLQRLRCHLPSPKLPIKSRQWSNTPSELLPVHPLLSALPLPPTLQFTYFPHSRCTGRYPHRAGGEQWPATHRDPRSPQGRTSQREQSQLGR